MQIAHPRFIHVRVKIGERGEKKKRKKEEEENGHATFYDLSSQFQCCGNYEQAFINISG